MKTIYIIMPGRSFNPDGEITGFTQNLKSALDIWNQDKGGLSIYQTQLDLTVTSKVEICAACGQVVQENKDVKINGCHSRFGPTVDDKA